MFYVEHDGAGNIIRYGVTTKEGFARKGANAILVTELKPKMDVDYKVKNDKAEKRQNG